MCTVVNVGSIPEDLHAAGLYMDDCSGLEEGQLGDSGGNIDSLFSLTSVPSDRVARYCRLRL